MINPTESIEAGPKTYVVVDYEKQIILPGEPTLSLIEESYKTEIGKVNAVRVDGVWRLAVEVAGSNEPGNVVYVDTL